MEVRQQMAATFDGDYSKRVASGSAWDGQTEGGLGGARSGAETVPGKRMIKAKRAVGQGQGWN